MRFIWDCTKLFAYVPFQGYHGQGKYLENDFFQVREKSGNFVDGQGNLEMTCGHMPFNTSCPLCFSFVLYSFCFVVGVVLSGEPKQNQGRGLVDRRTLVQAPPPPSHSNFIAGLSKAAPLFWFFGDFICGALLLMVSLVIYKYKKGKNSF